MLTQSNDAKWQSLDEFGDVSFPKLLVFFYFDSYIYIYLYFIQLLYAAISLFCGSCKGVGLAGQDDHHKVGCIPPRRSANAGAGEAKSINSRTGFVR